MKGASGIGLTEAQSDSCITAAAPDGSVADLYPGSVKLINELLVSGVLGHWCKLFG